MAAVLLASYFILTLINEPVSYEQWLDVRISSHEVAISDIRLIAVAF
jgi:hypothetical protein